MYILIEIVIFLIIFMLLLKVSNGICKSNVSLVGKTALITGGNKGIGYHTALGLAARGCKVIIASRTSSENVKNKMIELTKNPNIIAKTLDLGSLISIRNFTEDFKKSEERLDILINNAGVVDAGNTCTKDGMQLGMQVNHFGPFLLTHLLVDLLKKSAPSRIIYVGSWMAFYHNLKNIELLNNPFIGWNSNTVPNFLQYSNTKLCNIIISNGFADKLKPFGVTSNSLNPGTVATDLFDKSLHFMKIPNILIKLLNGLKLFVFKTEFEGAQTSIHLAVSDQLENDTGKYYWDCVPFFVPERVKDAEFCKQVWEESERQVHLKSEEKI